MIALIIILGGGAIAFLGLKNKLPLTSNLSISLEVRPSPVTVGRPAMFLVRITNHAKNSVLLRPDGQFKIILKGGVKNQTWSAEIPMLPDGLVTPSDLVTLQAAATWEKQVWPAFRNTNGTPQSDIREFPAGKYGLRAEYSSTPTPQLPVWGGQIVSKEMTLTIDPLSRDDEASAVDPITLDNADEAAIEQLGQLDTPASVDKLLQLFQEEKEPRLPIIRALRGTRQPGVARRIIKAIVEAQSDKIFLLSGEIAPLIRSNASCEDFELLTPDKAEYKLTSQTAILLLKRCSEHKKTVRALFKDTHRSRRDRAAALVLLGYAQDTDDLALYKTILEGKFPETPIPAKSDWEPIIFAAVDGLIANSSSSAKKILEDALNDTRVSGYLRNKIKGPVENWNQYTRRAAYNLDAKEDVGNIPH